MKKNVIFDYKVRTGSLLMPDMQQEVIVYDRRRNNVIVRSEADGAAESRHTIPSEEIGKIMRIIEDSRLSGGVEKLSEYTSLEQADMEQFYLANAAGTFEADTRGFINGTSRYGKASNEENLIIALGSVAEVLESNRIPTGLLRDYTFEKQQYAA